MTELCRTCPARIVDRKQKQATIQAAIKTFPFESDRKIAERLKHLGTDHKTVAKFRDRLIASGEIPQPEATIGKDGRKRRKKSKPKTNSPVFTCYQGQNADLIEKVAELYFRDGDKIADVTYGKGAFWKKVDTTRFDFWASDLVTTEKKFDFTALPYDDSSFDVVVFDPPYVSRGNPGNSEEDQYFSSMHERYKTSHKYSHQDILDLYREGMEEAYRVLRFGGLLLVKTADESSGGRQRMTHIDVHNMALDLGFMVRDLFVLHRVTPPISFGKQAVARKNHSYLWVFDKP